MSQFWPWCCCNPKIRDLNFTIKRWTNSGTTVWKRDLGNRAIQFEMLDDRVYLLSRHDMSNPGTYAIYCLDRYTGRTIWQSPVGKYGSASPDSENPNPRFFVSSDHWLLANGTEESSTGVTAFDPDGEIAWEKYWSSFEYGFPGTYPPLPIYTGIKLLDDVNKQILTDYIFVDGWGGTTSAAKGIVDIYTGEYLGIFSPGAYNSGEDSLFPGLVSNIPDADSTGIITSQRNETFISPIYTNSDTLRESMQCLTIHDGVYITTIGHIAISCNADGSWITSSLVSEEGTAQYGELITQRLNENFGGTYLNNDVVYYTATEGDPVFGYLEAATSCAQLKQYVNTMFQGYPECHHEGGVYALEDVKKYPDNRKVYDTTYTSNYKAYENEDNGGPWSRSNRVRQTLRTFTTLTLHGETYESDSWQGPLERRVAGASSEDIDLDDICQDLLGRNNLHWYVQPSPDMNITSIDVDGLGGSESSNTSGMYNVITYTGHFAIPDEEFVLYSNSPVSDALGEYMDYVAGPCELPAICEESAVTRYSVREKSINNALPATQFETVHHLGFDYFYSNFMGDTYGFFTGNIDLNFNTRVTRISCTRETESEIYLPFYFPIATEDNADPLPGGHIAVAKWYFGEQFADSIQYVSYTADFTTGHIFSGASGTCVPAENIVLFIRSGKIFEYNHNTGTVETFSSDYNFYASIQVMPTLPDNLVAATYPGNNVDPLLNGINVVVYDLDGVEIWKSPWGTYSRGGPIVAGQFDGEELITIGHAASDTDEYE